MHRPLLQNLTHLQLALPPPSPAGIPLQFLSRCPVLHLQAFSHQLAASASSSLSYGALCLHSFAASLWSVPHPQATCHTSSLALPILKHSYLLLNCTADQLVTLCSSQKLLYPPLCIMASNAPQTAKLDRYVVIHVATTCDEHGVYVTKDSAEVIELGWILLDTKSCEEVSRRQRLLLRCR